LEESGNLRTVIDNKLVTTAVPRGAPIIIAEGQLGGNYAWKIQLPMLVTYQSASTRTTQDLLVSAIISRRSELEHPMGLGIAQIIAQ
jgi:intracellular multiplication protein IcmL